jgi:hypothetical protein
MDTVVWTDVEYIAIAETKWATHVWKDSLSEDVEDWRSLFHRMANPVGSVKGD